MGALSRDPRNNRVNFRLRHSIPAAVAVVATGAMLNAPTASAEIGAQVVIAGGGLSNGFGTGCTYQVVANGTGPSGMTFSDNGIQFATTEGSPTPKTQTANWTPTTPGTHTILITQADTTKTIVLTVGTGVNAGSSCLVL
ncbi:hypothetical protein ACFXHA_25795 [Nocardia sp. NPDC059240]|uniref:hypothetical protein n=1 Tax=Nocardia sp. NPDC059240 TaxID=3346786 RepID=UPI00368FE61F